MNSSSRIEPQNLCADAGPSSPRSPADWIHEPVKPLVDEIAKELWERFAPDHHIVWGEEPHKSQYLYAAEAVLNLSFRAAERPEDAARNAAPRQTVASIEAMTAGQPEDVWQRAGYWRANACVVAAQRDELLVALKAARGALYVDIKSNVDLEGFDPASTTILQQVDAAIAEAE